MFILGPEHLDRLRAGPDEVVRQSFFFVYDSIRFDYPFQFNQPLAISDELQMSYTLDPHQISNSYHMTVLRTDVNRSLTSYIPDILDESILATDEMFKASEKQGRYLLSRTEIVITL